jgi:V/A-type H+-transporting ATPase subunit D
MALKVQYNKTYMQQLTKGLRIRENALPTLQAKESALRLEVKKARQEAAAVEQELAIARDAAAATHRLWREFPAGLLRVDGVDLETRKVAGVKTPSVRAVRFVAAVHSLFVLPAWVPPGMETVKRMAELAIRRQVALEKMKALEYARRKTTQKVNLYEKVQIPEYKDALLMIKRFLEDEDNLAKSSQKILKARIAAAEAA